MKRRSLLGTIIPAGLFHTGIVNESIESAHSLKTKVKKKPKIMFYHDGRHPLIYMYEPPMQKEELQAAVDELLGTPVDAIMFTMGDGRTVLHNTVVGELWGHNIKKWPHLIFRRAYQNAKSLIQAGHDPLRVVCDRAHSQGLLVYPVLLVQQGTGKRGQDVRASEFRLNNRHLEIGAAGGLNSSFPGFHGLDFKHKMVREERFALIKETMSRYPVDGFELQLNYLPYYFHPREVKSGKHIMTAWIKRVYETIKNSGEERELAIRIPADLERCESVGLDVREWLRQNIVDILIGESFSQVDQMINLKPLLTAAQDSNCRIHGSLQSTVDSDRLLNSTLPITRAAACNLWDQGVDGLYLNQWFSNWPYEKSFYEKLRELPYPEVMDCKDKFYFVPTTMGRFPNSTGRQLPADLHLNKPVQIKFKISDDLPRWHKVGRVHEVLLRIRLVNTTEIDHIEFHLNGHPLPNSNLRKINEMFKLKIPRFYQFGYWFVYKLDSSHWPEKGSNHLEIELIQRDPVVTPQIAIRNVELEIKYLMGKNLRRFDEIDLGAQVPKTE